MKKKIGVIFLFFTLFFFTNCVTGQSGKVKVITAYMPSGNLKYYIRPGKMVTEDIKKDSAYVMIDFTYQMVQREYVSDAYANFTLNYKGSSFVTGARFLIPENKIIELLEISTLDRDTVKGFVRVSTVLGQKNIKEVLESMRELKAVLEVSLDDGSVKRFIPTEDIHQRVNEAFSK